MLISAIVPTRGKPHLVRRCVEHLQRSTLGPGDAIEILVLEQAGEASRPIVEGGNAGPWPARWLPADPRWNFSQINNAGIAAGRGELILLLNNDCFVEADCVAHLVAAASRTARIGVVGAKLLYEDGSLQHIGVAIAPGGYPVAVGHHGPDDGSRSGANEDTSPAAVTFACALLRRACWDEVGGLDPAYHFNYEDVDFCLAARDRNWGVRYAHRARAVHLESATRGTHTGPAAHSTERNFAVLAQKWIDSGRLDVLLDRPIRAERAAREQAAPGAIAPPRRQSFLGRALAEVRRALGRKP